MPLLVLCLFCLYIISLLRLLMQDMQVSSAHVQRLCVLTKIGNLFRRWCLHYFKIDVFKIKMFFLDAWHLMKKMSIHTCFGKIANVIIILWNSFFYKFIFFYLVVVWMLVFISLIEILWNLSLVSLPAISRSKTIDFDVEDGYEYGGPTPP